VKDNHRRFVFVENLIDLIVTCIDHPNAANEVFLVSDDNDLSTFEMIRLLGKASGKSHMQVPVPLKVSNFFLISLAKPL
jgi:UDP-glucose 4-epimerase